MPKQVVTASYPLKIQAIRSKGQNLRFYVYLPMPLAAALGIHGGEESRGNCWNAKNRIWSETPRPYRKQKGAPDGAPLTT
jgi:hypothetical protein